MTKLTTILLTGITALAFTACGGGGGSATDTENTQPPSSTQPISGGSVGEPVQLVSDGRTYNITYSTTSYFVYTAKENERLIIDTILERDYTNSEKNRYITADMTQEERTFGAHIVELFTEQYEIATEDEVDDWGPLQSGEWQNQTYDYSFKKAGTYILNIGISAIPNATFRAKSI